MPRMNLMPNAGSPPGIDCSCLDYFGGELRLQVEPDPNCPGQYQLSISRAGLPESTFLACELEYLTRCLATAFAQGRIS